MSLQQAHATLALFSFVNGIFGRGSTSYERCFPSSAIDNLGEMPCPRLFLFFFSSANLVWPSPRRAGRAGRGGGEEDGGKARRAEVSRGERANRGMLSGGTEARRGPSERTKKNNTLFPIRVGNNDLFCIASFFFSFFLSQHLFHIVDGQATDGEWSQGRNSGHAIKGAIWHAVKDAIRHAIRDAIRNAIQGF